MVNKAAQAAQQFVPIKEIRSGVVVLKTGALRAVLMTSSLNFSLKSEEEQRGIIYQFQNMLNSLEFPIQIIIQSRDLDIRPYIALLEERQMEQVSELLKLQTREYINFVKRFTETVNIMSKDFYIVVPYTPTITSNKSSRIPFFGGSKEKGDVALAFEEQRTQLEQRTAVIEQGFSRTGLRVVQLGTEELVELFYKTFNPGDLEKPVQLEQQQ